MARIRTIKPEFWTDETLGECSPITRLLFVASLNFADDNGNLERSSRQLKAQAFPYDSIDCEPLITELLRHGLFIEYQISDRKYLHIKGFLNHQRIDRPSKCRIPLYEESMRIHGVLDDPSTSPRAVREGKGRESKGREGKGESDPIPSGLDLLAWERWQTYRIEIRKPLKTISRSAAQRELAKHGAEQNAVVEQSIANGWTGLFPLKALNGKSETPYKPARSAAEILAEEEREQQSAH